MTASQPDTVAVVNTEQYWTTHNVTGHQTFGSVQESLDYLSWRNEQYYRFAELMPVSGFDGLDILDFGCGPGNDLLGFATQSRPRRLIGIDVSPSSVEQAKARMALHGQEAEIYQHDVQVTPLPLEDSSIDLVRACGVIQHMPYPEMALKEIRRVLRPGGTFQVLAYNRDSIWYHLYVPYVLQIEEGKFPGLGLDEAFALSTDGPGCPYSRCYTKAEHQSFVEPAGFVLESYGVATACWEMIQLPKRHWAILHRELAREHRDFLARLTFDERSLPLYGEYHAGIDGCYTFKAV